MTSCVLSVQLEVRKNAGSHLRDHTPSKLPGIPATRNWRRGEIGPEVIPQAVSGRPLGAMRNEHKEPGIRMAQECMGRLVS